MFPRSFTFVAGGYPGRGGSVGAAKRQKRGGKRGQAVCVFVFRVVFPVVPRVSHSVARRNRIRRPAGIPAHTVFTFAGNFIRGHGTSHGRADGDRYARYAGGANNWKRNMSRPTRISVYRRVSCPTGYNNAVRTPAG